MVARFDKEDSVKLLITCNQRQWGHKYWFRLFYFFMQRVHYKICWQSDIGYKCLCNYRHTCNTYEKILWKKIRTQWEAGENLRPESVLNTSVRILSHISFVKWTVVEPLHSGDSYLPLVVRVRDWNNPRSGLPHISSGHLGSIRVRGDECTDSSAQ